MPRSVSVLLGILGRLTEEERPTPLLVVVVVLVVLVCVVCAVCVWCVWVLLLPLLSARVLKLPRSLLTELRLDWLLDREAVLQNMSRVTR